MKTLITLIVALGLFSCTTSPVDNSRLQQESFSDVDSVTLSVGDLAPEFTLPNGNGELQSLSALLEEKHVMLLFYRGEWCPYCIDQLESFEAVLPELTKNNVQLVAISPDKVSASQNTQRNFGLDYLFLSDTSLTTVKAYGIAAESEANLPHPAIFLINQQGEIVWFHASENFKERPTGEQMLTVVKTKL